jgi:hypothetical protein
MLAVELLGDRADPRLRKVAHHSAEILVLNGQIEIHQMLLAWGASLAPMAAAYRRPGVLSVTPKCA